MERNVSVPEGLPIQLFERDTFVFCRSLGAHYPTQKQLFKNASLIEEAVMKELTLAILWFNNALFKLAEGHALKASYACARVVLCV